MNKLVHYCMIWTLFSGIFINGFVTSVLKSSRLIDLVKTHSPPSFTHAALNTERPILAPLMMAAKDSDGDYYAGMDFYQILETERTADSAGIKAAYRKQVIRWHPDKYPDDPEKRKEGVKRMESINKAWNTLKDPQSRAKYDKPPEAEASKVSTKKATKGQEIEVKKGRTLPTPEEYSQADVDEISIGDLFEELLGGFGEAFGSERMGRRTASTRHRANNPSKGEDLQIMTEIPFMTSIFGGQHKVIIKRATACKKCGSSGVKPGAKVKTCETCRGKGMTTRVQRTAFGSFQQTSTCAACRGVGESVEAVCDVCRGQGTNVEEHEVDMRIPAGIDNGATLKIKEGGNDGMKFGGRGDLFVQVKVADDPNFKRQDQDILQEEEISYMDAILGTKIEVETVHGKHELVIPKGTQPGTKLVMRGFGVPKVGGLGQRGDAIVTIKVSIPKSVSDTERALLDQIRSSRATEGRSKIVL